MCPSQLVTPSPRPRVALPLKLDRPGAHQQSEAVLCFKLVPHCSLEQAPAAPSTSQRAAAAPVATSPWRVALGHSAMEASFVWQVATAPAPAQAAMLPSQPVRRKVPAHAAEL